MSTPYLEAVTWLYSLAPRGIRLELNRIKKASKMLGSPERQLKFVHVAGTNGKGSTSALLERCLRRAGYRTGLFTSPHLHRFVERIRINGRPIGERELVRRVRQMRALLAKPNAPSLTFFEVSTLIALETFRDAGCDIVVLEVGLGGRLDSTNIVQPEVSVITNIGFDHMAYLGTTIAEIAAEKAGIIKSRRPLVTGARDPDAARVIAKIARARHAKIARIDHEINVEPAANDRFAVTVGKARVDGLRTQLEGAHQRDNTALAIAALLVLRDRGFKISDAAIRDGIARTTWAGRLERVAGKPELLFDAAHNEDGCRVLANYLAKRDRSQKRVLLFAAMSDKNVEAMLQILSPEIDEFIFTRPDTERAVGASRYAQLGFGSFVEHVPDAIRIAKSRAKKGGILIVAGSIYLLGEVRGRLLNVRREPILTM